MTSEYTEFTHEAKTYGGPAEMKDAIFNAGVNRGRSENANVEFLSAALLLTAYVGDKFLYPYIKSKIEEHKKNKGKENQDGKAQNEVKDLQQ